MPDRPPGLTPADPVIRPPRRWLPSIVWIVPLVAALIGLSLVIQALWERGPTITVSFATAEGIEAGKTKVKFKNVDIGEVKEVHLAEDRSQVYATIELLKEARSFAVADSKFWVVRPRLAGSGVSGLETLLSGAYIGVDAGHSRDKASRFTGLENPPAVASDVPGRRFRLSATDIGSLDVGSPVFLRRIQVGHVETFTLDPNGRSLTLGIFVNAPYDHFVTTESRFWHASGIDLRLDANGVRLNTQSLASILMGGVSFETPAEHADAPPAGEGTQFTLAADHGEALKNPDGEAFPMLLRFHQSVRGLAVGAPVDFRGVEMGHVRSIGMVYDEKIGDFSPQVLIDAFPERLVSVGIPRMTQPNGHARPLADSVGELVGRGLRAQLRTGSLLTGQLYVSIDFFPDAPPVRFDPKADPVELPTVPGDLEELYQQVQSLLRKFDKIPFDALGQDAHAVMVRLDGTLKRLDGTLGQIDKQVLPSVRDNLDQIGRTMTELQASTAADAPLQQDSRQALRALTEATRSLKALTDSLERQPESLLRGKKGPDK